MTRLRAEGACLLFYDVCASARPGRSARIYGCALALAVLTASLYTSHPLSNLPQPKLTDDGCRKTLPVSLEKNLTVRASA